jgi:Arc/MetJ family transcription regulator
VRTNIVIDDRLMEQALRASGATTKRQAVELGLKALLTLNRQQDIRKSRGKLRWQGDIDAMRRDA